jgi:dTDP-glucose 4,6-dehydratase
MVTGGAGFIGSNLVRLLLHERPDWEIVNFDALTYAGNLASLTDVADNPRYHFILGNVADSKAVTAAMEGCWGVLHLAAETHVDRSILDPGPFLRTNVVGTQVMLDAARFHKVERFVQVSTDEVYGSLKTNDPAFTETNPLKPNSPYAASKASADLLVRAYVKTYILPAVITRCSNNYGPFQFPEKLIPLLINNALQDKPIPVYGDGMQVRDWIYVEDHCRALLEVLERGRVSETYNIGGRSEMTNLELVKQVLRELGKPESLISFVKDRPGHDRRYAMDTAKIERELGWKSAHSFAGALPKTVNWYINNTEWVKSVTSGEYLAYYQRQYGDR